MLTRGSLIAAVALVVVTLLGTGSESARALSFGPDLGPLQANSDPVASCGTQLPDFYLLGPTNRQSCMWTFFNAGSGASLGAPVTGTVTAVRVKIGAITGKMRVNVVRFLFQQTGDAAHPLSAGPFLEAYGPEFTPAANAVTTVPTSLPVTADATPDPADTKTIAAYDYLALEVEAPDVPVPVFASAGALTYRMYPGPTLAGVQAPSPNAIPNWTGTGAGVLMNADMTPAGGGGATTPAPAPAPAPTANAPALRLPAGAPVARGVATIPVVCQIVDCSGTLALRPLAGTAARKRAAVSYGSARFALKAGSSKKVKVTLTAAGRRLLARHRSVKVQARVTYSSGGGKPASSTLTLRRG